MKNARAPGRLTRIGRAFDGRCSGYWRTLPVARRQSIARPAKRAAACSARIHRWIDDRSKRPSFVLERSKPISRELRLLLGGLEAAHASPGRAQLHRFVLPVFEFRNRAIQ